MTMPDDEKRALVTEISSAVSAVLQKQFDAVDKKFTAINDKFTAINDNFTALRESVAALEQKVEGLESRFDSLSWEVRAETAFGSGSATVGQTPLRQSRGRAITGAGVAGRNQSSYLEDDW